MKHDMKVALRLCDLMVGTPKFSYPARQNWNDRPKDPFLTVRFLEEYLVGTPSERFLSEDLTAKTITYRQHGPALLRFRISLIHDRWEEIAPKLMHGWGNQAAREFQLATGYGVKTVTTVSNEDSKLENEWVGGQGFSLELYTDRMWDNTYDTIEHLLVDSRRVLGAREYLSQIQVNE